MWIAAERDLTSPKHTAVISCDSCMAFLYTYKQLQDKELFCCHNHDNTCVSAVCTVAVSRDSSMSTL